MRHSAKYEILLPGEDETQYATLESRFFRELGPRDAVAEALVHELVGLQWKKQRLKRLEQYSLAQAISAPVGEEDIPLLRVEWPPDTQRVVLQLAFDVPESHLMHLYKTYTYAVKMQAAVRVTLDDLNEIEAEHPELWRRFQEVWIAEAYVSVLGEQYAFDNAALIEMTRGLCKDFVRRYFDLPLLISQAEVVYAGVRAVQAARIQQCALDPHLNRAYETLSRAFSRVLQELRKHQRSRPQGITT